MAVSTLQKDMLIRKITASSHTVLGQSTNQQIIDCSYNGYTPIGLLSFDSSNGGSSQNNLNIYTWGVGGNNLVVGYRNLASAQATVKPTVTILYIKN